VKRPRAPSRFHLPRRLALRFAAGFAPFVLLAWVGVHFDEPFIGLFALAWGVGVTTWQVLVFGYGGPPSVAAFGVTRFYSKPVLTFLALFWLVLISWVTVALYRQLPG